MEVEVVEGDRGELTVLVDGREIARKKWHLFKPSVEKVVAAVRAAQSAAAAP